MKNLLRIERDNYNDIAQMDFTDEINYLVNELNIYCEQTNNNYINIVEQEKRYSSSKEEYDSIIEVSSIGYSQGDYINYIIHYNKEDLKDKKVLSVFNQLNKVLSNTFTHYNNQYTCSLYEYTVINNKTFINEEPIDTNCIVLTHIEFPEDNDIIEEYNNIFGLNYNEIEVLTQ